MLLGERLDAAWAKWDLVAAQEGPHADEVYDAAHDECSRLVEYIEGTSARTFEGLRVKAKAISWCHCGDVNDIVFNDQQTTNIRLAQQIVTALLASA